MGIGREEDAAPDGGEVGGVGQNPHPAHDSQVAELEDVTARCERVDVDRGEVEGAAHVCEISEVEEAAGLELSRAAGAAVGLPQALGAVGVRSDEVEGPVDVCEVSGVAVARRVDVGHSDRAGRRAVRLPELPAMAIDGSEEQGAVDVGEVLGVLGINAARRADVLDLDCAGGRAVRLPELGVVAAVIGGEVDAVTDGDGLFGLSRDVGGAEDLLGAGGRAVRLPQLVAGGRAVVGGEDQGAVEVGEVLRQARARAGPDVLDELQLGRRRGRRRGAHPEHRGARAECQRTRDRNGGSPDASRDPTGPSSRIGGTATKPCLSLHLVAPPGR